MGRKKKNTAERDRDSLDPAIAEDLGKWLLTWLLRRRDAEELHQRFSYDEKREQFTEEGYYTTPIEAELVRTCTVWMAHQMTAKKVLRQLFSPIKNKSNISVRKIRLICEMFLKEYEVALRSACREETLDWLDTEDIQMLASTATAVYLERWLENDSKLRRNIHYFSEHGYEMEREKKPELEYKGGSNRENQIRLWRAYANKYYQLFMLRRLQSLKESTPPSDFPSDAKRERPLNLVTLTWCSAWNKGYLEIIDILFFRKLLLNRKSKRDVHQDENMESVLKKYREYLEHLKKCGSESGSDSKKAMEYVAGCILLQKIERSCHVQLAIDMAHYLTDNHLEMDELKENLAAAYWGRYSGAGGLLFDSANGLESIGALNKAAKQWKQTEPICLEKIGKISRKYVSINDPMNILNNQKTLQVVHQTADENTPMECRKELLRRSALMDLLMLLYTVFPIEQRHSWSEADFKEAAEFYCSDCPVVQTFLETPLPVTASSSKEDNEKAYQFYDLFFEFYTNILEMDDSPLHDAISLFTQTSKRFFPI